MFQRSLPWVFFTVGLAALGIGLYGLVQDLSAGPTLALETTELDLGAVVIGQELVVEVTLHNRGGGDRRVVGECFQ